MRRPRSRQSLDPLVRENTRLRERVAELEGVIAAIRAGAVDALVVDGDSGAQLFARAGADRAYRALIEDLGEGAITLGTDGAILYCNQRFAEMLAAGIEKVIGTPLVTWLAPADRPVAEQWLQRADEARCAGELSLRASDGTLRPVKLTINAFQLDDDLRCLCVTVVDVATPLTGGANLLTALHERLERERHLAMTDCLTNVANRRAFRNALASEIRRGARYGRTLSIAYLDVDDFKQINDLHGHLAGDRVLETVGAVIRHETRTVDTAARLGGDEFAVLLPETDQAAARVVVGRIDQALQRAMAQHGWPVTFSIGVLTGAQALDSPDDAMARVDWLMYQAKTKGKHTVVYATEASPAVTPDWQCNR